MDADYESLLNTFVWAVRRMRCLQRSFETTGNVELAGLMRAAEREVDELAELHALPPHPTTLPFLAVPAEGGAR